jgi:hypothetical protein
MIGDAMMHQGIEKVQDMIGRDESTRDGMYN